MRGLLKRIAWKLWGRRQAIRQMRKLFKAPPPTRRENDQIYRTISKEDAHFEHYKDRYSRPLPPPPDDTEIN